MTDVLEKPAPTASPARRAALSKPEQSRLILTGTAGVICAVLFLWLLAAQLIPYRAGDLPILSLATAPPPAVPLPLMTAPADVRRLGGSGAEPAADFGRLGRQLDQFLDRHAGRPVMIHLAGPAATWTDGVETRTCLLTGGEGLDGGLEPLRIDEVVALIAEARGTTPTLLVLDLAQVGSDRTLPAFVLDLTALNLKDRPLAVLLSCAPGQQSWVSESQGVSVFAHYLAEALAQNAGSIVSADELLAYVRPRVAHWVREHRGAIQTPLLLGDVHFKFRLPPRLNGGPTPTVARSAEPPAVPPREEAEEKKAEGKGAEEKAEGKDDGEKVRPEAAPATRDAALAAVLREWRERANLVERAKAARVPLYRNAPVAWRGYQETLLYAERLARVGDLAGADLALKQAQVHRSRVEEQRSGEPLSHPWSLTLAERPEAANPPAPPGPFDQNVRRLLEELEAGPRKPAPAPTPPANPPADGAPAAPAAAPAPAPEPTPLEALAGARGTSAIPYYVEGQVPVWYAHFVEFGGESTDLQASRLDLIRRAVAVRKLAERAAGLDDRVVAWVRGAVDQADQTRRQAQDRLFATERAGLEAAGPLFDQAENLYAEALALGEARVQALDLLDQLRDELPYYGDWLAREPRPMDSAFRKLIQDAQALAVLAEGATPPDADPEAASQKLRAAVDPLKNAYARFQASADGEIEEAVLRPRDWREVDALLHLPMLPLDRRAKLLELAGSAALSPAFDGATSLTDAGTSGADAAFWHQALNLAEVELHLLRLAGLELEAESQTLEAARAGWEEDPAAAIANLAKFTEYVRGYRKTLIDRATVERGADAPLARLAEADRAARFLPQAQLRDLEADPARELQAIRRRELIVWHAGRLADDFALREARQVLAELGGERAPEAEEVAQLISRRSLAALDVKLQGQPPRAQIAGRGEWPEPGLASAFAARSGGPTPLGDSLLALGGGPGLDETFALDPGAKPVAFFRGHAYTPRGVTPNSPTAGEAVKVEVAQRYTSAKLPLGRRNPKDNVVEFPDQFVHNKGRAYLHPVNSLDYKLRLTNTSDEPLTVCVRHGLETLPPANRDVTVLTLGPHQTDETIVGTVRPADLPDNKPNGGGEAPREAEKAQEGETSKDLVVEVTENDPEGRPLAGELRVPFAKIEPEYRQDVVALPWYAGPVFHLEITNSRDNRVTFPAHAYVLIAPANAVSQIDTSPHHIPLGATTHFAYQVIQPVEKITWKLIVDEVMVHEEDFVLNAPKKGEAPEKAAPEAAPAPGGPLP